MSSVNFDRQDIKGDLVHADMSNKYLTPFRHLFSQRHIDGSRNTLYRHVLHMGHK